MANKLYEESDIQDIADAIREKTGSSRSFTVSQMAQMIRSITGGGNNMFDLMYPVGSIYMSVNDTDPSMLFGGTTWEQIKDTFLLSAGDTYEAGATGGEAAHTLTSNEMPTHSHAQQVQVGGYDGWGDCVTNSYGIYFSWDKSDYGINYGAAGRTYKGCATNMYCSTGNAGSSQPHNNMPPYLTVYMWKRTA